MGLLSLNDTWLILLIGNHYKPFMLTDELSFSDKLTHFDGYFTLTGGQCVFVGWRGS